MRTTTKVLLVILAVALSGCVGYNYSRIYFYHPLVIQTTCKNVM